MRGNFDQDATAPIDQPVYNPPPPRPDLVARWNFTLRQDVNAGKVYVSGAFYNAGDASIRRPFVIVLGVTITQEATSGSDIVHSVERRTTIPDLAAGEYMETPETSAPLIYRDQGNARYDIELILDIMGDVTESKSNNNRSSLRWYFYRPGQADGERILRDTLSSNKSRRSRSEKA